MNELWDELKNEIESSDNREATEMIALIRQQLKEIEVGSMSYPEFLEMKDNSDFGSDK